VLVAIWAVGSLIGLLGIARALLRQRRALLGQLWQPAWWTEDRRRALARKVGLRRFPTVWRSPAAPMPMLVGLWRPRVVGPESAPAGWRPAQWEAVPLHEAAHVARRDPLAVLAERLAGALFWWCPLMDRLSRRLDGLRETICDDHALEGTCDHFTYAALLVE